MKPPFRIDDIPATSDEIIQRAKEYGYSGNGGLFLTSEASQILRNNGHEVTTNQNFAG